MLMEGSSKQPLGLGQLVLCQMEGVDHVLLIHHIAKCSCLTPSPPLLFDHSLTFWINVEVERRGGISYLRSIRKERLAPADSN